jgi:dihydropteroate synthase
MNKNDSDNSKNTTPALRLAHGRDLPLTRPLVMGVLNVTPDSFSDGGRFATTEKAVEHALRMEEDGADIIDIGGESTRPGADPVSEEVECSRVMPVIERLRDLSDIPISVDTYKSAIAEKALKAGANIVNDVSAMSFDTRMFSVVAKSKAHVILMHMQGTPREMQVNPQYENCVTEVLVFLRRRIDRCLQQGIDQSKIIVDPGIGFGKRLTDNLEILARFKEFSTLKVPVVLAASRKSFIGMLHNPDGAVDERLGGSVAAAVVGVMAGADIVRAHDVSETVEALKIVQAIRGTA